MTNLYKKCIKCGSHAYLTTGYFYYCTNDKCLFKEHLDKKQKIEVEENE